MNKFSAALPKKNTSDVRAWLEQQDFYIMHKPVRKILTQSLHCPEHHGLVGVRFIGLQSLEKYYDMYRYILFVIDVLSKYLHLVPVNSKSGSAITFAFRSLFHDDDSRRPV